MASDSLRDAFRAFTTTCALITTEGPRGPNVMAAEWTFNVSYHPFLVLVSIDPENRTHDMILEAKEFGINLVSEDQIPAMAFAGHYSKADTDKLSSELFETYPAKKIHAPMIRGSVLAAECRLVQAIPMGDHTGFLGEVVEFTVNPEAAPAVLHHGSRHLGERIAREPGVAVAVTPMEVAPGSEVSVTGELVRFQGGIVPITITIHDADGRPEAETTVQASADGSFGLVLRVPATTNTGVHGVLVQADGAEGRARLHVR